MGSGSIQPAASRGMDYSPVSGILRTDLATDLGTSKSSHHVSPQDGFEHFYSVMGSLQH